MGTSSSYGGPRDATPLLPAWALPPQGAAPAAPLQTPEPLVPPGAPPLQRPPIPVTQNTPATPSVPPTAPLPTGTWTSARGSFTRALSSRTPASFQRAARDYVRAARGSGRAAGSAVSGKRSVAAFGSFLSAAVGQGLRTALENIGLANVVGRDVNEVLAAISNALAPDGVTKEEVAARQAVNDALEVLYERFLEDGRDLAALEAMTPEDIAAAIETCVEAYVYNRWLGDLGVKIEERAVSPSEAVALEREMQEFIREAVQFDLSQVDVMALDWRGEPGRQFVDRIYRDAYSLFGGDV